MTNMDTSLMYKEEAYLIIGNCMEVYNTLGHGFLEIVYKDALELVFKQEGISYEREKVYDIYFRDTLLPHKYQADFVIMNKIILEVKSVKCKRSYRRAYRTNPQLFKSLQKQSRLISQLRQR